MLAIINAKVFDGTGNVIDNGKIVIEDGKFSQIGTSLSIPEGCKVIDVEGKIVTPGLIDVHTHLGVHEEGVGKAGQDVNETSSEVTSQVRSLDGINPFEPGFEVARKSGITTVQIMPGSANVIGGEMVVVKTKGTVVDQMVLREPSGMKAATGENPKNVHGGKGKMPTTRMGVAARLREKFIEAEHYKMQFENGKVARNLGLENLCKVLNKEIPLRVHAHRADDIATVLRLKREFNIDITIEHCTEGHLIADFIAEHDVMVSVGPTMSSKSKVELANKGWHTLVALTNAGVSVSITTDHPVVGIEHLMTSAIMAVKNGLSETDALKAITINAAKHLGVEERVGSIEAGKDADFAIWSGDPFDLRSSVVKTYIQGECVFEKGSDF
ncbi:amidohydrolase [Heyndrickxia shackletonii]|uniref:Amidohydrolase n=1 Tax=Heyndrickxia shackletonii TaxID=157838 RepID=A0A0Q3WV71_9BACI|nr:amidohydrolase [Heyndrickxia shackletonii]KQL52559.1 amidohydrolase [Heyndrickxia shackletonii]NEZ01139.1 amidohydrolase [Heyndrickxia shackletonii]